MKTSFGIAIFFWNRHYKVAQLLQSRAVHFCDTTMNGDPCLMIGSMGFKIGVV